ncbi:hypothetical protein ABLT32_13505 [Bacteroides pyogenes]|uniref:hypothetical protein n=1 Tax=Bacteroides pyogenes TaxID=310300 RepID=UPI004063C129
MEKYKEVFVFISAAVAAYFDTTITFVYALLIGFAFNVLAGLRADEVKITMTRFPNFGILNYRGDKLVDSLKELGLITFITYMIKAIVDLMKFDDKSAYAVQILIGIAIYYYLKNGLRNLTKAYPKVRWIRMLYYLVSFKFKELMPGVVNEAIEREEEDFKKGNEDFKRRNKGNRI